jgi:hypothetical protein
VNIIVDSIILLPCLVNIAPVGKGFPEKKPMAVGVPAPPPLAGEHPAPAPPPLFITMENRQEQIQTPHMRSIHQILNHHMIHNHHMSKSINFTTHGSQV